MAVELTGTAPEKPAHSPYRWIILIGLITAAIMEVLDTTIVNVALPQMAGNLNATTDEIGWVSTGYILSNVIVLPLTAWLSARFGRKRYLVASIFIFIVASFFCGTSHSLVELVFWRIMQGAGGAALLSTAQATLVEIFPPAQQAMVQALFGLGMIVAPTIGPALGGWITDNYTWPWVFYVNIPIGFISVGLVSTFLEESRFRRDTRTIDWAGIGLLAVGLGCLQYVLEEGNRDDWFDSALITRLTIIAVVSLIVWLIWELSPSNKSPVVDLRVLKDKGLSSGLIIGTVLGFGLFGGVFLYPLFAQNILHFTPTATGLVLVPGGLATAVAVIFCGRALSNPKVDPRALICVGMATFTLSMWELGHLTTQSGQDDTQFALLIRGVGLGFLFIPITVSAFANLKGPQIAQGSALFNLSRQLGGSFGIAILSTYVANQTAYHRHELVSYLYSGNVSFAERVSAMSHNLIAHGYSPAVATPASYGFINQTVQAQAMTMAYNDAFLLIGVLFVIASPAVFLLGKRKGGGGPMPPGE
jgi:DHA2 family multidrug resistance protein